MRRITHAAAALLLVAASAGAGVKWKRAKDLEIHSLETDPTSYVSSKDEYEEMYTLVWRDTTWGAEIGGIAALYVDWSVFRVNYRIVTGERRWKEVDVDKWRENFGGRYYFIVGIAAKLKPESRLSNRTVWTVHLEADGEQLEPEAITPAGAESEASRTITYINAPSLSNKFRYFNKGYVVTFVKPEAEAKPRNLKLVITGAKAQRGFEWRFQGE